MDQTIPDRVWVVYRNGLHAILDYNFQILPRAAWLKFLLQRVPDHREHLERHYGRYINRSRWILTTDFNRRMIP